MTSANELFSIGVRKNVLFLETLLGNSWRLRVGLALAVVAGAGMWVYTNQILKAYQVADAAARDRPRGNLSDLYPRWLGARELLLHGRDPYSTDITREIQVGYYGRPLDSTRPNDPKDQQGFAYPVYVAFLLAPTVKMPFAIVQWGFFGLLVIFTAASVVLWLRALGWRISTTAILLWIALTLGSFPAIQGLKLQQITLLVATLLAGAMSALAGGYFVLSGVLLALAGIKPQLVALPALFLCIWTLGNWRERQKFFWSFASTMLLLVLGGEILLPGWIAKFRASSADYWRYTGGGRSVLDVELTPMWGHLASAALICMLLYFVWRLRRVEVKSSAFGWLLALTLATTLMVIPMFAPYNQVLLVPVAMAMVRTIRSLCQTKWSRLFVGLTALSVFWPWIAAVVLVSALFFLPGPYVQRAWAVPLFTNFVTPTLMLALVLLARKPMMEAE
jgi:hypothetical protein